MESRQPTVTTRTGTYTADFTAGNYRNQRIARSQSFGSFTEVETAYPNGRTTYSYSRSNRQHHHLDADGGVVVAAHTPTSQTTGGSTRNGIRPNAWLTYD